jgi:SpoVK/Ycf46/Vps4 family AAA+-type ATPase
VRELKEFATNIIKGEHYEENGDDVKTIFTVSQRLPFLIDEGKEIYCIVRETGEQKGEEPTNTITKIDSRFVKFNISLFSYKSSVPVIKEFVKSIKTEYSKYLEEKRRDKLFIYTLNNAEVQNDDTEDTVGGWKETPHETMKSFQNLFFEGKREVMEKIDFFINNKDWYKRNGIPYTLGIALYGPPGTGKTSFIKALSTYLNRHIISMTLSRIKTPKQLHDFYFETQYNNANDKNTLGFDKKIIVFEDIDCIGDIILKRKTTVDSKTDFSDIDSGEDQQDMEDYVNTAVNTSPEDQIRNEITKATKYVLKKINSNGCNNTLFNSQQDNIKLDDLLNLWDGIRENTGRIMIITTNHYDKLDPALIRPGRIDIALNLGNTSRETIAEMYMHYYRSVIDPNDYELIPDRFYSPAEIINIYVSNSTNPQGFIERLISKKKFNKE